MQSPFIIKQCKECYVTRTVFSISLHWRHRGIEPLLWPEFDSCIEHLTARISVVILVGDGRGAYVRHLSALTSIVEMGEATVHSACWNG